jgi:hypothetical protein
MPPSVKNGDNTGSKLSANAAICEVGDSPGSIFTANAAVLSANAANY